MKIHKNLIPTSISLVLLFFFTACSQTKKEDTPWVNMFDGSTLEGWSVIGGNATYEIVNGGGYRNFNPKHSQYFSAIR